MILPHNFTGGSAEWSVEMNRLCLAWVSNGWQLYHEGNLVVAKHWFYIEYWYWKKGCPKSQDISQNPIAGAVIICFMHKPNIFFNPEIWF